MPYCTLSDLKKQLSGDQLIQLTDDEGSGLVDAPTIDKAIADADAEIDAYLAERYPVPITPTPPLINRCSVDLAIYHLYGRRLGMSEDRKERRDATVKLLRAISDGKASLGLASPPPVESGGVFSAGERKFTRKTMKGF